jgi:hypothetical protein
MTRGFSSAAGDPVLDLFLAGGGNQHFDFVRAGRYWPDHLEVEIDLLEGKRNVLIGLRLHLHFHLCLAKARRQDDLLRDDRRRRQGHGHILG